MESGKCKVVLVTGISGCGRKEHLHEFIQFAKQKGKKIKTYYIGDMFFEHAKKVGINLTKKHVLNSAPTLLKAIRGAIFEKILAQLDGDKEENDAIIISMHSIFFWKKIFLKAYDRFYLEKINPDMFLTFIDSAGMIKRRLDNKEQWQQEALNIEEILLWQNIEAELTAGLSEVRRKPFFVVPAEQPTDTLYKLIFHPDMEPIYASFPMTHLKNEKSRKRIDSFVNELNKYFTVFDPRTIEISINDADKNLVTHYQTINRDLYWLVNQSKKVIAFFPEVVTSTGVINELREAYETNKDVWLIFPKKEKSPFTLYFCNRIFMDEKEFFIFLRNYVKEKLEKKKRETDRN